MAAQPAKEKFEGLEEDDEFEEFEDGLIDIFFFSP